MPAGDYSTGRDLHIDAVLSNIVIGRQPDGYVADQLLPILNVNKRSDVFYRTNHKEFRRYDPNLSLRAPNTLPRKVDFSVSSDTYYAKNYALGSDWSAEDEVNADEALQYNVMHSTLVNNRLLIDYEMRVAALANTFVATTTNVATPYSNTTGSRPLDDLQDQYEYFREATGVKPNVILYPEEVGVKLRRSDQIRDRLYGDRGGVTTDAQIANLLNIPKVLVPSLLINSAGEGETLAGSGTLSAAWGKKIWMFYINPLPGRMVDTWAQAFRWTNPIFGIPWAIQRPPFDMRRLRQEIFASYYQDEKIISQDLAMAVNSVL